MEKWFIQIVNHLRTIGKTFHNEDLINKVLICLNLSWQFKVTVISESKDFPSMDFDTFFGKFKEYETEAKRVAENEGDKRKKIRALKFKETNETKRDEDVNILVCKFKKKS